MNTVFANNYDNLAALAAFPALATLTTLLRERTLSLWVLIGLVFAGLVYTYPELAVVVGSLVAVMVAERLWKTPTLRFWAGVASSAAVFAALVSPYASTAVRFLLTQARTGFQAGSRPGEGYFPGLLVTADQASAFWSLGGENQITTFRGFQTLAAVGVVSRPGQGTDEARACTRCRASLCALPCRCWLPLSSLRRAAYSYGAYKMIRDGLVGVGLCRGERGERMARIFPGEDLRLGSGVGGLPHPFLLWPPLGPYARLPTRPLLEPSDSALCAMRRRSRPAPPSAFSSTIGRPASGLSISCVALPFAWETSTAIWPCPTCEHGWRGRRCIPGQMCGLFSLTPSSKVQCEEMQGWTLVWQNAVYRLWNTGSSNWAIVTEVRVPNGLERVAEKPFFWMGGGPTRLRLIAREAGCVRVSATMIPGPRVKRTDGRTITIESTAGQHETVALSAGSEPLCVARAARRQRHHAGSKRQARPAAAGTGQTAVGRGADGCHDSS